MYVFVPGVLAGSTLCPVRRRGEAQTGPKVATEEQIVFSRFDYI